jgi:hypothetical protein
MRNPHHYMPDYPFAEIPDLTGSKSLYAAHRRFSSFWYVRVDYRTLQRDLVNRLGLVFRRQNKNKPLGPALQSLEPCTGRVTWYGDMTYYSICGERVQSYGVVVLRGARYLVTVPPPKPVRKSMTPKLRYAVLERGGFRCAACGATAAEAQLQVDHIQPVAAGGTNAMRNLQALCQKCNIGKGAQWKPC